MLNRKVSTPLPSGKVCDGTDPVIYAKYLLFQHLYLLGRSATKNYLAITEVGFQQVSTPLPSGKVCDKD